MNRLATSLIKLASIVSLILTALLILGPLSFSVIKGVPVLLDALQDQEVQRSIALSMVTTVISTLLIMILASGTILSIAALQPLYNLTQSHRIGWFSQAIKTLLIAPVSLPHLTSGLIMLFFFGGLGIGPILERFGCEVVFTTRGIIVAQVAVNLPFVIEQLWAAYQTLDRKMLFQALTLNITGARLLFSIVIPTLRLELLTLHILCFSRVLGEYGAVMMVAGITRMKTEIIPTAIFLNTSTGNLNTALALSLILIGFSLILSVFHHLVIHAAQRSGRHAYR